MAFASSRVAQRLVRGALVLTLAATLGGWLAAPGHASARSSAVFGVTTHFTWHSMSGVNAELDRMAAAGLAVARLDVYWNQLEPQPGVWDTTRLRQLDAIIAAMDAHGITGTFTLLGTPAWARGNAGTIFTPPLRPQDFGAAAGYIAARYAHHAHMIWEIWNEPNDLHFWHAARNPALYTRMLRAAYVAIKTAAPSATVLGGAIAFNDRAFLNGMYAAGARGFFDGLSLHPYTIAFSPLWTGTPHYSFALTLKDMEAIMALHGERNKPIYVTEMGWSTYFVSDAVRAVYLREAVALVRAYPFVKEFDATELDQSDNASLGLLAADGTPTLSWTAYTAAVNGQ